MSMKPPVWRCTRLVRALVPTVAVALIAASAASAAPPPDGRTYELVSPADKGGGLPSFPTTASQAFFSFNALSGASGDGNRLLWMSVESFANANSALQMSYESQRTPSGWETKQASPDPVSFYPNSLVSQSIIVDATDDLSRRIIPSREAFDSRIQGAFGGFLKANIFLQQTDPSLLTWVSGPDSGPSTANVRAIYEGRDATASHIVFTTPEALTPNASSLLGAGLYDHTGGQTVLVDVDNNGDPIPCGASLGGLTSGSNHTGGNLRGAVSSDGSRIAFAVPDQAGDTADGSCTDPAQVFVRKNGTTAEASADQRTVADPLPNSPATFMAATDVGGDKVFFTSDRALTDDAANGTAGQPILYQYDVDSGALSLITPNSSAAPWVTGVLATSKDGSRIYFTARQGLTNDAPPGVTPGSLYLYDQGQIKFIAALSSGSIDPLIGPDTQRPVRVTDDGDKLLFQTSDSLGGANTGGFLQIYLYDASDAALTCVSCPADGSAPAGEAWLQRDVPTPMRAALSRNVTDDGRVFFDTPTSLVAKDQNGAPDVYEWDNGELRLITDDPGDAGSYLIDTANDGHDVFFVTTAGLVPQDTDGELDVYDARIGGGGFPAPPPAPVACTGDQCQGQPTVAPDLPDAKSATVFGDGNAPDAGPGPKLSVKPISAKARRAFARHGQVTLVLKVTAAGTAHAVAHARIGGHSQVVGLATEDAARARALHMSLVLSPAAKRQLAKTGRLKVTIVVTFTGAKSRKATLTLVQPAQTGR